MAWRSWIVKGSELEGIDLSYKRSRGTSLQWNPVKQEEVK